MNTKNLETHIIQSNEPSKGTLIWMHGLGASNHDFDSLIPDLTDHYRFPLRFVFPNAPIRPVSINGNMPMPAWYDIYSLTHLNKEDVAGVETSAALITALVEAEIARGTPADKIILVGFSQGGAMALHTGLRLPYKIAGIIGLSCYLPMMPKHNHSIHEANRDTPILMMHGTHDMTLPLFVGKMGFDTISSTHPNIEWREYPMQHEIRPAQAREIFQWVADICLKINN